MGKKRVRGYFTTQRGRRRHTSARQHRLMHQERLDHTHVVGHKHTRHRWDSRGQLHRETWYNPHPPQRRARAYGSGTYLIGFLGTMAMVTAIIIFMYGTTFQSPNQGTILSAVVMLVVGVVFAWIMVGVRFEPFQLKHMVESIVWTAVSVGAIWIVNKHVPFNLDVTPLSTRLFSVLMGVAEESFFRLWLTTFILNVTKSSMLAIGVSSGIWTTYHISRYGGDMSAFFVLFMAGLVLGFVMLYSKMADGVIFAHAMVNYLATA